MKSGTSKRPPINKIINETLGRNGKLTEANLEQRYETYLSQIKITDRIDKVGACCLPLHRQAQRPKSRDL